LDEVDRTFTRKQKEKMAAFKHSRQVSKLYLYYAAKEHIETGMNFYIIKKENSKIMYISKFSKSMGYVK
jgi:hypothetical protein